MKKLPPRGLFVVSLKRGENQMQNRLEEALQARKNNELKHGYMIS